MLGYLLIFGAAALNTVKGYCSKRVSGEAKTVFETVAVNLLRNLFCVLLGAFFVLLFAGADLSLAPRGILICSVAGASLAASYTAWILALRTDSYVFTSATNSASFLVSAFGGILFFGERLTVCKGLAILSILIGMAFMLAYQRGLGGLPDLRGALLLALLFFSQGLSALSQKWFTSELPAASTHTYTFYSFLVSVVLLALLLPLLGGERRRGEGRSRFLAAVTPWAAVMALALYGVTFFQAEASRTLDAVVLYPLSNGLTMVGGALMAWLCFGERPNGRSIGGMAFVLLALILSRF